MNGKLISIAWLFKDLTKDSIYYCKAVRPNRKGMIPRKAILLPD
jgi:hypothetical protein